MSLHKNAAFEMDCMGETKEKRLKGVPRRSAKISEGRGMKTESAP